MTIHWHSKTTADDRCPNCDGKIGNLGRVRICLDCDATFHPPVKRRVARYLRMQKANRLTATEARAAYEALKHVNAAHHREYPDSELDAMSRARDKLAAALADLDA